jgi:hypothetical protein
MKKILIASILCILASCNNTPGNKQQQHPKKTESSKNKRVEIKSTAITKAGIRDSLIGIWTHGPNENASFKIDRETFYYTEDFASYKYTLIKDSVHVFYDDGAETFFVKFKGKDTLVLNGEYGETTFFRMK